MLRNVAHRKRLAGTVDVVRAFIARHPERLKELRGNGGGSLGQGQLRLQETRQSRLDAGCSAGRMGLVSHVEKSLHAARRKNIGRHTYAHRSRRVAAVVE